MGFKEYLLHEWIYNSPRQKEELEKELQEIRNLVNSKKFHDASLKMQPLWNKLEKDYLEAKRKMEKNEIDFLLPILRELHKTNKEYINVRGFATKEY